MDETIALVKDMMIHSLHDGTLCVDIKTGDVWRRVFSEKGLLMEETEPGGPKKFAILSHGISGSGIANSPIVDG